MKKLTTIIFYLLFIINCWGQAPQKVSYQAIIRNHDNQLITNQTIGVKFSVIKGTISQGTIVYSETQSIQTDANGLISTEIGNNTDFSLIDWSNGTYVIKSEIDILGGNNYTITGSSQLLSVPYALHAKTAENVINLQITGNEQSFENWDKDYTDDFDGQYSSLTGVPTQISTFTNDAGYITTESDPIFSESEAANISASDITNLSHLSGTNTGDQDLSSLALKTALADTAAAIRQEINNDAIESESDPIFLSSEAYKLTTSDITNLGNLSGTNSGDQDLSGYLTTETDPVFSNSEAANLTASDITKLSNLSGVNTGDQDLSNLVTNNALNDTAAAIRADIPEIDGSETKLVAGNNVIITGSGTNSDPYEITASNQSHYIGEIYGGGIVFWISADGQHGLIASLYDLDGGSGVQWSHTQNSSIGETAQSMTDGEGNTAAIVAQDNAGGYAATICNNYSNEGYSDWYLPSNREMKLLASNDILIDYVLDNDGDGSTNGFNQEYSAPTYGQYWTSTETNYLDDEAWFFSFRFGDAISNSKAGRFSVRAIRAF